MFKVVEFQCTGIGCPRHFEIVEKFILPQEEDEQLCTTCNKHLHKVLSAVRGYVPGSRNPVRQ